jgi:hypothetical protein
VAHIWFDGGVEMTTRLAHRLAGAAALATVLATAGGLAAAATPPPTGPVYPPPGGVTLGSSGDIGRAGGHTFTYSDLQLWRFDPLMWGVFGTDGAKLAMDGAIDAPGETLSYSSADSSLGAGLLRFTGSAVLPGVGTFPTRVTIRPMTPAGAPLPLTDAAQAQLPPGLGGVAVITGDYKANILFEVLSGSSWVPAKDFFDAAPTSPSQDGDLITSFGGGFYYVPANVPPEASFTYSPSSPKALQTVSFSSTSTDSDGAIVESSWDLDGDGQYDDASGTSASRVFDEAGTYTVGLRVLDDRGGAAVATQTVTVRTCERTPVSQTLRTAGAAAGAEPTAREINCDVLEPLGL